VAHDDEKGKMEKKRNQMSMNESSQKTTEKEKIREKTGKKERVLGGTNWETKRKKGRKVKKHTAPKKEKPTDAGGRNKSEGAKTTG